MIDPQKCFNCGKEISDEEWVVNWGACAACFDAYLDAHPLDPLSGEAEGPQ